MKLNNVSLSSQLEIDKILIGTNTRGRFTMRSTFSLKKVKLVQFTRELPIQEPVLFATKGPAGMEHGRGGPEWEKKRRKRRKMFCQYAKM